MSDFGLLASRFNENTNLLRGFDEALRYFKESNIPRNPMQTSEQTEKLLYILRPVAEKLNGFLSKTMTFDEQTIVAILKQRRVKNWLRYQQQLIQITGNLSLGRTHLTKDDFEVLNDVADAMDTECANLFRRISGQP